MMWKLKQKLLPFRPHPATLNFFPYLTSVPGSDGGLQEQLQCFPTTAALDRRGDHLSKLLALASCTYIYIYMVRVYIYTLTNRYPNPHIGFLPQTTKSRGPLHTASVLRSENIVPGKSRSGPCSPIHTVGRTTALGAPDTCVASFWPWQAVHVYIAEANIP